MQSPDSVFDIVTLGRFCVLFNNKPVVLNWPDEALLELFCALLSPLDLFITWDRLCRSMLGISESQTNRQKLEVMFVRPLNAFLTRELGFTPLIIEKNGITINRVRIRVDAHEFHNVVLEGLKCLSRGEFVTSRDSLHIARSLYVGSYLPGMPGKIIESTRNELESLYRTAVLEGIRNLPERDIHRDLLQCRNWNISLQKLC